MQLPGKFFDSGNDSRRGSINSIANHRKMAIAHGIEKPPAGARSQRIEITRGGFRMGCGKDQILRLQVNNLLQAHLWPILAGLDDGDATRFAKCIGDKGVLAGGNKWFGPDNEQDTARRYSGKFALQRGEPALKFLA